MLEDVTVPKELEFPVASSDEMSAVLTDSGIEAHASRTDDAKVGDDLFCVSPSCFALSLYPSTIIHENVSCAFLNMTLKQKQKQNKNQKK